MEVPTSAPVKQEFDIITRKKLYKYNIKDTITLPLSFYASTKIISKG